MHIAYVSFALIAGMIASFVPAPMQGSLAGIPFLAMQQQVSPVSERSTATALATALERAAVQENEPEETGSIGKSLTCEQIRILDEVELITDDSYCTERG